MNKRSELLNIRLIQPDDVRAWNRYVEQSADGTFFHRAEWRDIFESALAHRSHYLLAEEGAQIRGVLPLVHIRSRLFSNLLGSLPFLAYGGILADDAETAALLENRAQSLGKELGVDFVEMRNRDTQREGWLTKGDYVTFRKEIPATVEGCMQMIPRKQRAMVRKGIKHGLESKVEDDLSHFYGIFSESYRNLGTPVLSRGYYEAIQAAFGKDCEIMTIFKDGEPVASVMSFYFKDEVIPYYGGSVAAARRWMANDFMYWELLRRASEAGLRVFDYGRSRVGTGSYRFKKHWGFTPEPLHFQYHLVRQADMPDLSPGNPKYRMAIAVWKRLPTALTRIVGPKIARGLPG
jgi:FemAB-related protein (PEP-CTERM system-associated)